MELLWMIVIGFLAGLVARFIKPGRDNMGFVMTTLVGIVGAVVGGYLGRFLGLYEPGEPAGFIVSVLGAIVVLFLFEAIAGRRTGYRT